MVEDVAANGAAAQGGVLAGDILHALTVVMDRSAGPAKSWISWLWYFGSYPLLSHAIQFVTVIEHASIMGSVQNMFVHEE